MHPDLGLSPGDELRALTVAPEWAWAIMHAGKDENRNWRPKALPDHRWLAIHAGAKRSKDGEARLRRIVGDNVVVPEDFVTGAVLGFVRVEGVLDRVDDDDARRRWWAGPGWLLWCFGERVVLDEPVRCRGSQMLWELGRKW